MASQRPRPARLPALRAGRNAAIVTGDRRWFAVAGTCDFAPGIRARREITGLRPAGPGGIARSRQILAKTRPRPTVGSRMTGRAVRQPSFRRGFQKVHTARWSAPRVGPPGQQPANMQALRESPLSDSNRRPLPYHGRTGVFRAFTDAHWRARVACKSPEVGNRSVVGLHNKVPGCLRRTLGVWIAPRPRRSMTPDGRRVLSSCSS